MQRNTVSVPLAEQAAMIVNCPRNRVDFASFHPANEKGKLEGGVYGVNASGCAVYPIQTTQAATQKTT